MKRADLLLIPVFVAVVVLNVCALAKPLGIDTDTAVAMAFLWVFIGLGSVVVWSVAREDF